MEGGWLTGLGIPHLGGSWEGRISLLLNDIVEKLLEILVFLKGLRKDRGTMLL